MHRQTDLSLKAARVEKGFTQDALAEKLGVSKRTIVNWENGEVELKPLVIYALSAVYQMNPDFLRIPIQK